MDILSEGDDYVYAAVDNVLITFYRGSPQAEPMRQREPWAARLQKAGRPGGLLVFVDRDAQGAPPSAEARAVSRDQAKRYRNTIMFSSVVIEGDGLGQRLLRTSLRGLAVLIGKPPVVKFSSTLAEGASWAAKQARPGPGAHELADAVHAIRGRF